MALISMRQLLDHAAEHNYGVPAFNVNNLEQMRNYACRRCYQFTCNCSGICWSSQICRRSILRHLIWLQLKNGTHSSGNAPRPWYKP